MVTTFSKSLRTVLAASAMLLLSAGTSAWADPPGRVARMSYIRGDVGFQPGGSGEWSDAVINRPLVTGDRLSTDRDARVELEIGAGSIRVDERSTVSLLDINDSITQIELTDGTLNLDVRRLLEGQSYEVDTPTLAFVVSQPGEYRVDVAPDGDSTMVTVFRGSGDVYGENNASYRVRDGNSYRFNDSRLRDYEVLDLPRADDFDRFCQERNERYERAVSSRYVSDEVVGYADLDSYGSWDNVASYGSVWYPRGLRSDWAPYRDGHWAWIDPWGWSWVDDQPWGFAPSHYGRWAYIGSRWGWVPGPRHLRPVYAPALVAFVGGSNWGVSIGSNPVGWFPLSPRDVYRPWYDCSRDYFTRVNTRNTIINNVTVVNIYNDYSRGRPSRGDYTYRRDQRAFTAVPGNVFASAKPVGRSRLRVNDDAIGRGSLVNAVGITPTQASLAGGGRSRANQSGRERFDRPVVARNAPPAQVLPFAQREAIIRANGNRSPGMEKLRARGPESATPEARRVRVIDAKVKAPSRNIPIDANRDRIDRSSPNRAERSRPNADQRNEAGNVEQRVPSTRYSPATRKRPSDDNSRKDSAGQVQRNDQASRTSESRESQNRKDAADRAERLQPQAERQVEQQRSDKLQEERRAQSQQRREQPVEAIELPQQQRRSIERSQVQPQQRADQSNRFEAQQAQRDTQVERMKAQEQQRADQANRGQTQQMQRQQEQQLRQAQMQQRQQDMQSQQMQHRQQQAQQAQAQRQQQFQQQVQQSQPQAPSQQQAPAPVQREQRKRQREAKEEKQER